MVDHEPKRPYEPFLMSEEDCMSFSSFVLMTILVICNIEVKQKQFFWHRKTARSPLGPPEGSQQRCDTILYFNFRPFFI